MKRNFCEVLEDEDEIKLLEAELYAFQRCDLDICQCDHQEWRIGQMDQAFSRRLEANIGSEGNSLK
jgi:hypothetical protein